MASKLGTAPETWKPALGCWPEKDYLSFRVWAPRARDVQVAFRQDGRWDRRDVLQKGNDGFFSGTYKDLRAGDLYGFFVDGKGPLPDPASRYQPEGVQGPSAMVDSRPFVWADEAWTGIDSRRLVFYELHIGTFTSEGTFKAAIQKLPYLRDLGVTAIEILPVADFPGNRNWGYDGVDLFAPARCYGTPDDLRQLVNDAHRLGLAVFLDVVYNHLGPEGNYTAAFSPFYFTDRHQSPWGAGVNLDGPESRAVRDFFIENALYWIHEFHFDGLRLDATHALVDEGAHHFLAELAERVHHSGLSLPLLGGGWPKAGRGSAAKKIQPSPPPSPHTSSAFKEYDPASIKEGSRGEKGEGEKESRRRVYLIAEDHRNLTRMIQSPDHGGWGLDGVWSDDFHHELRRLLAGDHEGYYQDYEGSIKNLAAAIEKGWLFTGQYSRYLQKPRGQDAAGTPYERFVIFIQNHDQVGNRAFGERLNLQVSGADYRAASALLLFCPETPLLFMGQEWAASSPFLYFTDHPAELGRLVTEGRRREFQHFSAFADPARRTQIPDPQEASTFLKSKLSWDDLDHSGPCHSRESGDPSSSAHMDPRFRGNDNLHTGMLTLYKTLLHLRQSEPALLNPDRQAVRVHAIDESTLLLERRGLPEGKQAVPAVALAVRFKSGGETQLPLSPAEWAPVFHTEESLFADDGKAPRVEPSRSALKINFEGPCAMMFRRSPRAGGSHG